MSGPISDALGREKKQIDLKNAGRKKRKTATSETSWARGRSFEEKHAVNYK